MKRKDFQRFINKIVLEPPSTLDTGCWRWIASLFKDSGYGQFRVGKKNTRAHRTAYIWFKGPIPQGLQLDHLCRNRWCVNPTHLEPVTHRVNAQRGNVGAIERSRTHCIHGHPLIGDNLYAYKGKRYCRICRSRNRATSRAKFQQQMTG